MDDIDWSQYCVVRINEYKDMRAEIERLRRLIHEWSDANNFGSLYGDDLTKAVDRVIAAEEMLRKEARRG